MTQDRVMLLIDADNVSVDVIEQAVAHLLRKHTARCTCAAPTARPRARSSTRRLFRRLSIKPMVNLSTGKNSTDIALAVDAVDLVLAERPDVVAIASSDSDFAPLVARLREKGCRVVGIGQEGKTGDETQHVYDEFTVMAHRKTRARRPRAAAGAQDRRPRRGEDGDEDGGPGGDPGGQASRRPAAAETGHATAAATPRQDAGAQDGARAARRPAPAAAAARGRRQRRPCPRRCSRCWPLLPELRARRHAGAARGLGAAARGRLLSRSGSSTKLFGQFADRFELLPPGNPNHVRLRGCRAWRRRPKALRARGSGCGAAT